MRTHYCFTDTPHTIVSLSEQSSLVSILRGGSLTTDTQTGPKGQHVESLATRCASSGNYQHCFPLRVLVTFMEEKKMTLITGFLISLSHERRYSFLWSKQSSVLAAYVFFSSRHTTNSSFVLLSVVDLFRLENVEKFFVLSFPHKSHEGNWIATEADKKKSIGGHDIWASYTGKYRLINRPVSKRKRNKKIFPFFSATFYDSVVFVFGERKKSTEELEQIRKRSILFCPRRGSIYPEMDQVCN